MFNNQSEILCRRIECPNCHKKNSYSYKESVKAEAYGYYTCKNCGAEYNEYGLIDEEKD